MFKLYIILLWVIQQAKGLTPQLGLSGVGILCTYMQVLFLSVKPTSLEETQEKAHKKYAWTREWLSGLRH